MERSSSDYIGIDGKKLVVSQGAYFKSRCRNVCMCG